MALKAYRATERADFLPMFFFMFVFLLFAAKESVFMKNSRLLRGAETVLFALMTAAYAGYLPVLPVTLALGAGVAASLFRAPVSFDAENGEAFFNRDYRRFSTYASMLAGSLCGSVLSVETALAAMTALCAVRTLASFFEKRQEPDMRFIGARRVISSFAQIRKYAVLCRASFGISWMWATGYLLLVNVDELAGKNVLFENVLIFSAAFSFWGGCAYAKRLARQILDFTLSPLNTAGMTLCLSILAVLSMYDGAAAKAASLILWSGNAFCAGMYVLPLSLALRTRVRERNFQALVVTTKFLNLACFLIALILTAGLNPRDVFFNALPMFHSFGLGMATVMTTLHGIKTVYYPSPLHYKIIPELIYDTNATVLVGTDTFLAGYGEAAHPYDFYSLRLAIVGAEKLKESTEKLYIEKFCIRVIEGYGATECSPLISVNSRMYNKRGSVGRIVPALDYKLEEAAGITDGKRLLLKGGNVMMGYMRPENPRVLEPVKDGWYDTGDIVEVDDEDFIFIKGRAKRFAKVGGEMISLGAIEGAVNGLYPDAQNAVVAVADAKKGEKLVLFTTRENADAFEIKKYVREKGLSDLGVPSKIVVLAEIPLLSSGKVDYPSLQTMAAS